MKAAIYGGVGNLDVREVPKPGLSAGGLVVKVHCCLLCGTDMKLYYSGNPRCKPPQVIGHEFVGEIVEKDPGVAGFEVGDRVTAATTVSCGKCHMCSRGLGNICEDATCFSYNYPGALAQYMPIPALAIERGNIVKVPDGVSSAAGALSEPLSCAINAHEIVGLGPGDSVAIIGAGPLGMLHVVAARAAGAAKIAVAELSETRLEMAQRFQPDAAISPERSDVKAAILDMTDGRGADVVIVAAPARGAMESALDLAAKGGRVSLFASLPSGKSDITLDSRIIHYRELRVCGASDSRPEHVHKALEMIAGGTVPADMLITHYLPLEKVVDGIKLMKEGVTLKVCIRMNDGEQQ